MYCAKCGAEIEQGSSFCQKCGAPADTSTAAQPQASAAPSMPAQAVAAAKTSGMAIASLVLGIIGLFFFPFVPAVLAIIFGAIGLGQINRSNGVIKGKGLAIAGIVIGIISIVFMIIMVALVGFSMTWFSELANGMY